MYCHGYYRNRYNPKSIHQSLCLPILVLFLHPFRPHLNLHIHLPDPQPSKEVHNRQHDEDQENRVDRMLVGCYCGGFEEGRKVTDRCGGAADGGNYLRVDQ